METLYRFEVWSEVAGRWFGAWVAGQYNQSKNFPKCPPWIPMSCTYIQLPKWRKGLNVQGKFWFRKDYVQSCSDELEVWLRECRKMGLKARVITRQFHNRGVAIIDESQVCFWHDRSTGKVRPDAWTIHVDGKHVNGFIEFMSDEENENEIISR